MLKDIYLYRDVLKFLVVKDIKSTYRNSVLGYFWLILSPLSMMLIFYFVFSIIVRIKVEYYPIFLLSALLPWQFLSNSLSRSTSSLIEHAQVIKASPFPKEYIPFSVVLVYLFQLILSIPILLLFSAFYKLPIFLPILPIPLLIQFMLVLGLSLLLSCMNVFYRDTGLLLGFAMLLWFYATPIFYPISYVPSRFFPIYYLNPMVYIVSAYRTAFLGYEPPPTISFIYSLVISILFLGFGYVYFKTNEKNLVKWL